MVEDLTDWWGTVVWKSIVEVRKRMRDESLQARRKGKVGGTW